MGPGSLGCRLEAAAIGLWFIERLLHYGDMQKRDREVEWAHSYQMVLPQLNAICQLRVGSIGISSFSTLHI